LAERLGDGITGADAALQAVDAVDVLLDRDVALFVKGDPCCRGVVSQRAEGECEGIFGQPEPAGDPGTEVGVVPVPAFEVLEDTVADDVGEPAWREVAVLQESEPVPRQRRMPGRFPEVLAEFGELAVVVRRRARVVGGVERGAEPDAEELEVLLCVVGARALENGGNHLGGLGSEFEIETGHDVRVVDVGLHLLEELVEGSGIDRAVFEELLGELPAVLFRFLRRVEGDRFVEPDYGALWLIAGERRRHVAASFKSRKLKVHPLRDGVDLAERLEGDPSHAHLGAQRVVEHRLHAGSPAHAAGFVEGDVFELKGE
jgi:hypothetical protein